MLSLIGNVDTSEILIVLIGAVLVFGKRLPQVAAQAGAQLNKLRHTFDSAWKESGVDKEVREMQRSIESIRDAVPRDLSAASIARTAATKFQERVEANQRAETPPSDTVAAAELAAATVPAHVPRAIGPPSSTEHVSDVLQPATPAPVPPSTPPAS